MAETLKTKAYAEHIQNMSKDKQFEPIFRADAGYSGLDPNISVRSEYSRHLYEAFRPGEAVPRAVTQQDYRRIMVMCKWAYERVGVIRSVVDMMSEFAAEGVEIIHEDSAPNAFYKAWQRKVKLENRVERALSWLYKSGNFVARRNMGKIDSGSLKDIATASGPVNIPLEYVLYDPSTIELIGDYVGAMSKNKQYSLMVPMSLIRGIAQPTTKNFNKTLFDGLPDEIKKLVTAPQNVNGFIGVPIPSDRVFVGYYKKDDSDIWGKSFIYSILSDVFYNDKLKLAKTTALDGFYNIIRIWKLGDHNAELFPSPGQAAKLNNILQQNVGGGAMDLIWDSMIELDEHYPPIDKLANFEEDIHNILLGLGVPESLVGGRADSQLANNTLGLKNLTKRLQAGRRVIKEWLESEIDIIQKEMGFRKRPIIRFANEDLHDEKTYYNLLVQLIDRNVISDATVLERIGESPEIEQSRIAKESGDRKGGAKPNKAGPFNNPVLPDQHAHEIKKIKLQNDLKGGDGQNSNNLSKVKKPNDGRNGRPPGKQDKKPRVRRKNTSKAALTVEAARIYDAVEAFANKQFINYYSVENARQFTAEQKEFVDQSKGFLMSAVEPFTSLSDDDLAQALDDKNLIYNEFINIYDSLLKSLGSDKVNNEQKKLLRIAAYIEVYSSDDDEGDIS